MVDFTVRVMTKDGVQDVVFHAFKPRRELAGFGMGSWVQTITCFVGDHYLELERSMSDWAHKQHRGWGSLYLRTDYRYANRMPLDVHCGTLQEYAEQVALLMLCL